MSDNNINIDLFDKYLRHNLTDAERAGFDKQLLDDASFNAEFTLYKTIALGIRDHGKAELKEYIKANGKVPVGRSINFRPGQIKYAIAATLTLFAVLYIVIQFYVKPAPEKSLSIVTSEEKGEKALTPADSLVNNPTGETASGKGMEPALKREDIASGDIAPPVMEELKDMARASDEMEGNTAAGVESEDDFKIASEKKLSDTVLLAYYLKVPEDASAEKKISMADKENANRKSIPGPRNYSNNNYNNDATRTEVVITKDTLAKAKTTKPVEAAKTDNYKVEYWQSPINFKGYKLVGYTLQLYGIAEANSSVKLFKVDFQLYLRLNGEVYLLRNCPDGCSFNTLAEPEISTLILNQK